ncbi:MAG: hypothetical protein V1746_05275 [bacterium]
MIAFLACLFEFKPTIDWSGIATVAAVVVAFFAIFWPHIFKWLLSPVLTIERRQPHGDQPKLSETISYHLSLVKTKGMTARKCRVFLSHMLKWSDDKWLPWPVYYKRQYAWTPKGQESQTRDIVNEASFDFLFLDRRSKILSPGILHGFDDDRFYVQPNEPTCFVIEIESETSLVEPEKKYVFKVTWTGQVTEAVCMECLFNWREHLPHREDLEDMLGPSTIMADLPDQIGPFLTIEPVTDDSEIQKMIKDYDRSTKS